MKRRENRWEERKKKGTENWIEKKEIKEREKRERQIDWTEKKEREEKYFLRKSRERINRWQNLATTLVIT